VNLCRRLAGLTKLALFATLSFPEVALAGASAINTNVLVRSAQNLFGRSASSCFEQSTNFGESLSTNYRAWLQFANRKEMFRC